MASTTRSALDETTLPRPLVDMAAETTTIGPQQGRRGPFSGWTFDAIAWAARTAGRIGPLRRALAGHIEGRIRARATRPVTRHPAAVEQDKIAMGLALLSAAERSLASGQLGAPALRAMLRNLYGSVLVHRGGAGAKDRFRARHGQTPGDFLVISPGKACNLRCEGCYSNSGAHKEKLAWPVFERIVSEAHREWGTRVFIISGGEPLAYKDQGRGVLDLAEKYPDCFFVMYTNGTLVDDAVARRIGRLGNLSPALSVEGMKEKTDARRGEGVFEKVLAAMARLRREGAIFGISLTATRKNAAEILCDEVVDLFFERMGVLYAFVFHYMPIGRAFTLDLMMTPEQRLQLFDRVWSLIRERHLFIADFWNSATASNGCLAGGRAGGYFHVNWNGDVAPCVFLPYAPTNVNQIFGRGGTLDDVWTHPFYAAIRKWQRDYGYREANESCDGQCGNWMTPCLIRDHHAEFMKIMGEHPDVRPLDDDAAAALHDPEYHAGLEQFDRHLAALTGPEWEERYRQGTGIPSAPMKRR